MYSDNSLYDLNKNIIVGMTLYVYIILCILYSIVTYELT